MSRDLQLILRIAKPTTFNPMKLRPNTLGSIWILFFTLAISVLGTPFTETILLNGERVLQNAVFFGQNVSSSGGNTFTETSQGNFSCSSSPCTVTHTFPSGQAVLITWGDATVSSFMSAISGIGTFTFPVGCEVSDATAGSAQGAYILSNTGGTSIQITYSGGSTAQGTFRVFSASPGPIALNECVKVDRSTASTTQTMISPNLPGTNITVMQSVQVTTGGPTVNSFTTAYSTLQAGGTFGTVSIDNTTSNTAPVANLSTSTQASVVEASLK